MFIGPYILLAGGCAQLTWAARAFNLCEAVAEAVGAHIASCCHLPAVGPGGLRWGFFFFGWDSWLIGLRFVFGAWGGSLGASVRADVRVCLAGSGRFYLECTVVQFRLFAPSTTRGHPSD